jgi:8-oxo-dGTP pyrophosphatase MutT (NUDIX family)
MPALISDVVDVYVFRRRGREVDFLLLRRRPESRLGNTWQSVHGRIEPGETAVQAALRELCEETSLEPLRFWQLELVNTFYVAQTEQIMLCPCFAAEVPASAEVRLCHEHTDFRWEAAETAAHSMLWPGHRRAIREVLEELLLPGPGEPFLRIEPGAKNPELRPNP